MSSDQSDAGTKRRLIWKWKLKAWWLKKKALWKARFGIYE